MISNSSPPRTAPLTTLNNSPFSRGARAVHQGQKKAKAYNISIVEPDSEPISGQSKDEGADGQSTRSIGETSPNGNCDSTALTPISKGILKRKREAEMEPEDGNGVTCSKKKVIFADPISATKLIESRKTNVKTVRKRRLRYEEQTEVATNDPQPEPQVQAVDKSSEPQVTVNVDTAVNSPDSENSDPVVDNSKQTKVDGKVRKIVKNGATSNNRDIPGISGKDTNCTNQMMKEPTVNSVAVLDKIVEHTSNNASGELGKTNLDDTSSKDGTSDAVFSELESLLQAIESPCADKESSRRVDPLVMDEVKESKTTENPIKDSSTDFKSNQMDHIKAFIEESPLNSPEARADEIIEPSEENEVNSIPSPSNANEQEEKVPKEEKKETEETKMDVDEEVNQPSTVKPLLESWVNVKKSVDLFIQSYCTMLTNRMKSWLNVKGINTIGDFANLVESSSDHLTESPICPLNEETIMSTFQFMIERKLNEESSSLKVEKVDDGRERGDGGAGAGMSGTETVKKNKNIDTMSKRVNQTRTKVKKCATLKVIMPSLPVELSSKIVPDKASSNDNLGAVAEILPPTPDTELECSKATTKSSDNESTKTRTDSEKSKKSSTATSTAKDTSTKKIVQKKVPGVIKDPPITKSIVKGVTPNKVMPKKPTSKNVPAKKFAEKLEPVVKEEEESPKEESSQKASSSSSSSSAPAPCVINDKMIELELKCKPDTDPNSIVPRASIVIKRLTEDEIMQMLRPKFTISMEISEEVAPIEGDKQSPEPSTEIKMIDEESLKVDSPPLSSSSPPLPPPSPPTGSVEDDGIKSTLSINDDSSKLVDPSPLRKSRRKRDSELPASKPLTPSTRRRRTLNAKID